MRCKFSKQLLIISIVCSIVIAGCERAPESQACISALNQNYNKIPNDEDVLIAFFSDASIRKLILADPSISGDTGGSFVIASTLDITGDDVPEVILTSTDVYSGVVYMGKAVAYDLHSKQPLINFYEANSPIIRYRDSNGKFLCLVYESLYMGTGICNSFVQKLSFTNNKIINETKFYFKFSYSEDIMEGKNYYEIYEDVPMRYIDEFHNYIKGKEPQLSEVIGPTTTSQAFFSYITGLVPLETNRQQLGHFMQNIFYGKEEYEKLSQAINKLYFYTTN